MKTLCQACHFEFEVPVREAGKIEFGQCQSVFRVTYRFKTHCPSCKKLLQLAPAAKNHAVGIPICVDTLEKTEFYDVLGEEPSEKTMVTPLDKTTSDEPNPSPTVRVSQPKRKEKSVAFRMISNEVRSRGPLHVSVVKNRRRPVPVLKYFLLGIIVIGFSATALLTVLLIQAKPEGAIGAIPPSNPLTLSSLSAQPFEVKPSVEKVSSKNREHALYVPRLNKVTSEFGMRLDPIDKDHEQFHKGLDIAAAHRAEIVAALDGTVRFVGPNGGYGNSVVIEHSDGYETLYGHLDKILVKKGKKVRQGDLIGLAGSTGRSTGTHLHFELKKDGKAVDPYRVELMSRAARAS